MHISLGIRNFLALLALILGVAALVAPRFTNVILAIFLIAYALFGLGLIR